MYSALLVNPGGMFGKKRRRKKARTAMARKAKRHRRRNPSVGHKKRKRSRRRRNPLFMNPGRKVRRRRKRRNPLFMNPRKRRHGGRRRRNPDFVGAAMAHVKNDVPGGVLAGALDYFALDMLVAPAGLIGQHIKSDKLRPLVKVLAATAGGVAVSSFLPAARKYVGPAISGIAAIATKEMLTASHIGAPAGVTPAQVSGGQLPAMGGFGDFSGAQLGEGRGAAFSDFVTTSEYDGAVY